MIGGETKIFKRNYAFPTPLKNIIKGKKAQKTMKAEGSMFS